MKKNYVYSGAVLLIAALVIGALALPMSPLAIGGPQSPPLYEGISVQGNPPFYGGERVNFSLRGTLYHEVPYSVAEKMFNNGARVELHVTGPGYNKTVDTHLVDWTANRVVNGQWESTKTENFVMAWKIPYGIEGGQYKATSKWKIQNTDTVVSMSSASLEKTGNTVEKTTQITPPMIATAVLALAGIGLIGVGYRREE